MRQWKKKRKHHQKASALGGQYPVFGLDDTSNSTSLEDVTPLRGSRSVFWRDFSCLHSLAANSSGEMWPARQHKPASNTERTACLPHFLLRDLVWSYSCLGYYSSSAKPGEALTEKVERKGQFLTGLGCQMLWKLCVVHLFISWSSSEDVSMIAAQRCNSFVS